MELHPYLEWLAQIRQPVFNQKLESIDFPSEYLGL